MRAFLVQQRARARKIEGLHLQVERTPSPGRDIPIRVLTRKRRRQQPRRLAGLHISKRRKCVFKRQVNKAVAAQDQVDPG